MSIKNKNMTYNVIADKIEIRSSEDKTKPRYTVNAVGAIANKKHISEYAKQPDGSYKTLKSMFTPHCIKSIKEQAKHKKIFVDSQHELVRDSSIKAIVKDKVTPEELKQVDNMLNRRRLPIAKLNDIDIEDNELRIYTELNPSFREVDEDHRKYFDAVWYSLENKFLNGISINFGEFTHMIDDKGDTVIDDVDVLGFSYLDAPAEHANSIYEVAIRSMEEKINVREGVEMEDAKSKLEAEKAKFEEDKKSLEVEKAAIAKSKADKEEETKKAEIDKQATEQKKIEDDLAAKTEEAKKLAEEKSVLEGELNKAKGVVNTQRPPSQPDGKQYNSKFYEENLKKITEPHDKAIEKIEKGQQPMIDTRMKGFGELINLQAKNGPTVGLPDRQVQDIREERLLERGETDIITNTK